MGFSSVLTPQGGGVRSHSGFLECLQNDRGIATLRMAGGCRAPVALFVFHCSRVLSSSCALALYFIQHYNLFPNLLYWCIYHLLLVPSWKGHMVSNLWEIAGEEELEMESDFLVWRLLQIWASRDAGESAVAVHNEQELFTYWCAF